MTSPGARHPGRQAHPEIFNVIPTTQPEPGKPGQLSQQQLEQLFSRGYVQVDEFFQPPELEPVKEEMGRLVDKLAERLHKHGRIKHLYKDLGLFQRLTKIDEEFPGAAILLHKIGKIPEAFAKLWSNDKLLNVAEQVLGTSDIAGHPVWNLRTRVPKENQMTVPWHQDSGYLDEDSYTVYQLTAWIPMLDAKPENGCMQVVSGGHRTGRIAEHTACWKDTWYIELSEEEMKSKLAVDPAKDTVTCPVPFGGALFFSNIIPHRSLPNTSQDVRWSLDLRWQRADKPVGFYGVKHGIRLRSSQDAGHVINWHVFNDLNRHNEDDKGECNFDSTVHGPWMDNWPLVHENRHTRAWREAQDKVPRHRFTVY